MREDLQNDYTEAENKFQFVLEFKDLYCSSESYERGLKELCRLAETEPSPFHRVNLLLGIAYMKRIRSDESDLAILKEIKLIAGDIRQDGDVSITAEIARGGVLLMKSRAYCEAQTVFEPLFQILKNSNDHFLFGIVSKSLGVIYMVTGRQAKAEEAFQNALITFRRYGHTLFTGLTLNDYAICRKKSCQYEEAEKLLNQALKVFDSVGVLWGRSNVYNNLGIIGLRTGMWPSAHIYFEKAKQSIDNLVSGDSDSDEHIRRSCDLNAEHLLILQRRFNEAESRLLSLAACYEQSNTNQRMRALVHEFLGVLYIETGELGRAREHLCEALRLAELSIPSSDVMTEVKRHLSQLHIRDGDYSNARRFALDCIRLSKTNGDKYERGAAIGCLGEIYADLKDTSKARSCFETSARMLRGTRDCYELMRVCIEYGKLLTDSGVSDAEIYLLEARQIGKQLGVDFYLADVALEFARLETHRSNFVTARKHIAEAERLYTRLLYCDQMRLRTRMTTLIKNLDKRVWNQSLIAAEQLKNMCRVYEDARFPMEELKPDLAYKVALSVKAKNLFLIRRKGRGYVVPLAYNIPVNEAKEIIRRLDRDARKPMLSGGGDPRLLRAHTGNSIVCVPARTDEGHMLCTSISSNRTLSTRDFELLLAGAEALERLVDSKSEGSPLLMDDFLVGDGSAPITHPRGSFKSILTVTPDMIKLIRLAERASLSEETILLEGETGVGKELFANAIHENSPRKDRPFVAINAGGMPVGLLESQLFGHVKGAFTDAATDRKGLIEEAQGGTVFLDEVGEMGPELQVKLLRLLENGEFRRLGENETRVANVRVVSATNRDLLQEVEKGTFRRDLYYRFGTVKLHIPALRFRQRDVELLVRHFLKQCAIRIRQPDRYFQIDVKAMEALELYDWPGNVRELQNEIRRIVSLIGESDMIRFGMLSQPIKEFLKSKNRGHALLDRSVERYERRLILDALNKNDWNRLRTAGELGLPRTTLLAKMRRLNVAAR